MKAKFWLASACLVAVVAGCRDNTLAVEDLNNPDVTRVFATPGGVEATIASGFQTYYNSIINTSNCTGCGSVALPSLITIDGEQYSSLNNFSMGPRGGIPRNPIQNPRGGSGIFNEFSGLSRGSRLAVNAVNALDALLKSGQTTGSALPLTPTTYANAAADSAQDMRDRAFGLFIIGMNLGQLALQYDSAAIVGPGMKSDSVAPLSKAYDVMGAALAMLDSANVYASKKWGCTACTPAGGAVTNFQTSVSIPASWTQTASMSVGTPTSQFPRFIESMEAYFRANVARNATDRADISKGGKVDWTKVIAEVENTGIAADITPLASSSTGYKPGYAVQGGGAQDPTWGQVNPMFYGMADVSGAYAAQIATLSTARGLFLIQTPDKRFPAGATRALQQAAATQAGRKTSSYNTYPYIVNRTAQDGTGDPWGVSEYDNFRLAYIPLNSSTGIYPFMLTVQLNLLAAEGHFRLGTGVATGLSEIDVSRTAAGLPPLTGAINPAAVPTAPPQKAALVAASGGPVPGGAACVPQVPYGDLAATSPSTATACGDAWEALQYEYRMETEYTGFAPWFMYNRGFNALIDGTAYEWPVPAEEMDARYGAGVIKFYNLGGSTSGQFSSNTSNPYHNFRVF